MQSALRACYDAAGAALAAGPQSRHFMSRTAECLKTIYILLHASLGTRASLEIGARAAEYSLEMARAYGEAISLYAFEASPRTHAYFAKEVEYKKFGVNYINALVSERDGDAVFYEYVYEGMEPAAGMSSILVRDIQQHGLARRTRASVKSVRGDTFIENACKNCAKIALWIDVEGAQAEVLHSLSRSFARGSINAVHIEVEKEKLWRQQKMLDADIIAFMKQRDFSPFLRDNEYDQQYNIIFVHNTIQDCDVSRFLDRYLLLLQKAYDQ